LERGIVTDPIPLAITQADLNALGYTLVAIIALVVGFLVARYLYRGKR
jgi:hypothetical protein